MNILHFIIVFSIAGGVAALFIALTLFILVKRKKARENAKYEKSEEKKDEKKKEETKPDKVDSKKLTPQYAKRGVLYFLGYFVMWGFILSMVCTIILAFINVRSDAYEKATKGLVAPPLEITYFYPDGKKEVFSGHLYRDDDQVFEARVNYTKQHINYTGQYLWDRRKNQLGEYHSPHETAPDQFTVARSGEDEWLLSVTPGGGEYVGKHLTVKMRRTR